MNREVLVVSHADADGHVIAEQVRRNLEAVSTFAVTTVIDPVRTKDHRAWLRIDDLADEVDRAEIVFFVDLMFAPASFSAEADSLVRFVQERPKKRFFVLDHHPLPLRRLRQASNLRALYRRDVLDCTIGPPSWIMTVAALCEKQETRAAKTPENKLLAEGLRRAAALGEATLSGAKLLALLRFDRWSDLAQLGREDPAVHRLPRGRRAASTPASPALAQLDRTATALLKSAAKPPRHHLGETSMSYDSEVATHRETAIVTTVSAQAEDLEAIVMVLELAAIYLTTTAGETFTVGQLLDEAREIGGDDLVIDEKDVEIVLGKQGFLKKKGNLYWMK